jgi:hypothetical protein
LGIKGWGLLKGLMVKVLGWILGVKELRVPYTK